MVKTLGLPCECMMNSIDGIGYAFLVISLNRRQSTQSHALPSFWGLEPPEMPRDFVTAVPAPVSIISSRYLCRRALSCTSSDLGLQTHGLASPASILQSSRKASRFQIKTATLNRGDKKRDGQTRSFVPVCPSFSLALGLPCVLCVISG